MKDIKTKERKDKYDQLLIDLQIDEETIETGRNPIESYAFWQDIENECQRALFRIKENNPKINFDFSLSMLTKDQKEKMFIDHLKIKYPDFNVDLAMEVIKKEITEIIPSGPDDNHPNPYLKFPIDSQLTRAIIVSIINKFNIQLTENGKDTEIHPA